MFEIRQTLVFRAWLLTVRDAATSNRINARLTRMRSGLFGDVKPVGGGVSELRLDFGPGYGIYFKQYRHTIILLLCAGTKKNQKRDIEQAKLLAQEIKEIDTEN